MLVVTGIGFYILTAKSPTAVLCELFEIRTKITSYTYENGHWQYRYGCIRVSFVVLVSKLWYSGVASWNIQFNSIQFISSTH